MFVLQHNWTFTMSDAFTAVLWERSWAWCCGGPNSWEGTQLSCSSTEITPLYLSPFSILFLSLQRQKGRVPREVHFCQGKIKWKKAQICDAGTYADISFLNIITRAWFFPGFIDFYGSCRQAVLWELCCLLSGKRWRSSGGRTVAQVELASSHPLKEMESCEIFKES